MISKLKECYNGSLLTFTRKLKENILKTYDGFLKILSEKSTKTSKGRQKKDYNSEFELICSNFMNDNTNEYEAY